MLGSRLQKWEKTRKLLTVFSGGSDENAEKLSKMQQQHSKDGSPMTANAMIGACKELIFDINNGRPIFHAVMHYINPDTIEIEVAPVFEILLNEVVSEQELDQEVRDVLAYAIIEDVPVYPNTKDLAPQLAKYHHRLLSEGFTAPDGTGERVRLKLTRASDPILDPEKLSELYYTATLMPSDINLIIEKTQEEIFRRDHAGRVIASLKYSISKLENLLSVGGQQEALLQDCLTENPVLFGTEYIRVIPKHRLGSDFEMDYALERSDGLVDIVEIEPASFQIFTQRGDPSSKLIHAEQQVLDWFLWIERNSRYARDKIPGLFKPRGFVIIGRSGGMSEVVKNKLRQRNAFFRGDLHVLTYDDLLQRAKYLLSTLEGLPNQAIPDRR